MDKEGLLFEEDNAVWFRSTKYGDDKDRVVKKVTAAIHTLLQI
ncbi:hypothetical protein OGZ02_15750 [Brachyspira hyodysenteriae]|nr:hypothetical protein [Brachyspira hyodysenteriae]MDA1470231.1 hypothetical protein [Brachyspira hyodysenteriae]